MDNLDKVTNDIYYVWKTLCPDLTLEEYLRLFLEGKEVNSPKDMRDLFNEFLDSQEMK